LRLKRLPLQWAGVSFHFTPNQTVSRKYYRK
jgi:hypothetical protein